MRTASIRLYVRALAALQQALHERGITDLRTAPAEALRAVCEELGPSRVRQAVSAAPVLSPVLGEHARALRKAHRGKPRGLTLEQATTLVSGIEGMEPVNHRDRAVVALRHHMAASELAVLRREDCRWTRDALELPGRSLRPAPGLDVGRLVWAWVQSADVRGGPLVRAIRGKRIVLDKPLSAHAVRQIIQRHADNVSALWTTSG